MDKLIFTFPDAAFNDWIGLHSLLVAAFAYMDSRIDPPSSLTRMNPDALREKARDELLLTCKSGSDLVAAAFVATHPGKLYIGKLAVREEFRRRGISRRIFRLVEDLARARGVGKLELQTRVELHENHRTFEALGFVKTTETSHEGYDRVTTITMTKYLSPERLLTPGSKPSHRTSR